MRHKSHLIEAEKKQKKHLSPFFPSAMQAKKIFYPLTRTIFFLRSFLDPLSFLGDLARGTSFLLLPHSPALPFPYFVQEFSCELALDGGKKTRHGQKQREAKRKQVPTSLSGGTEPSSSSLHFGRSERIKTLQSD